MSAEHTSRTTPMKPLTHTKLLLLTTFFLMWRYMMFRFTAVHFILPKNMIYDLLLNTILYSKLLYLWILLPSEWTFADEWNDELVLSWKLWCNKLQFPAYRKTDNRIDKQMMESPAWENRGITLLIQSFLLPTYLNLTSFISSNLGCIRSSALGTYHDVEAGLFY